MLPQMRKTGSPRIPRILAAPCETELHSPVDLLHGGLRLLVCLLVAAVGYCGTGDEVSSAGAPLSEHRLTGLSAGDSDGQDSGQAVIEFLTSRYQEAVRAFENGSYEKSWKLCEAIMELAPEPFPLRDEVRKLKRRAHGRHLSRSAVAVRFMPHASEEPVPFPLALLRGSVQVENLSKENIQFGDREEDSILGQIYWSVKEIYENGTERTLSDVRVLRLESGFLVEPGASRGVPITLPLPVPSSMPVLQKWVVTGVTRPIKIMTPAGEITRGLPWIPEVGFSVAKGYETAIANPKRELRKAMLEGDRTRLAISRYLWMSQRREDGISNSPLDPLVDELLGFLGSHDGVLDELLVRLLEDVTGLIRERSARAWKIWGVTRQVRRDSDGGR